MRKSTHIATDLHSVVHPPPTSRKINGRTLRACMLSASFLFAAAAQAANVDLTVSKAAPNTAATLTPFTYTITVGNIGNATTGASTVVDALPARLYDLVVTAAPVGTNGATCPTLADVTNAIPASLRSPATAESTAGQQVTIPIPSLPQGSSCEITFSAKATTPGSYVNTVTVNPAASDTETMPGSNSGGVTTSIAQANYDVRVTKELLTPATANFGDTVTYRITYYGDPVISVPNLGTFYPRTFDGWQSSQGLDGGSNAGVPYTSTIASCNTTGGATGCTASPPAVTAISGPNMNSGQLLSQTKLSLPAGSTLVIEENVVFTAPRCGGLRVRNLATVSLNANNGSTILQDANATNDEAAATVTLNSVGSCPVATNTLTTTKTLVNPADTVIDTEGEVVKYLIRSEYTSTDVPLAGITHGDRFRYYNQNGAFATTSGPALTHEIWITGCTVDALGTGSACPPGPYPRQLQGPSTSVSSASFALGTGNIANGGFVELALEERWTGIPGLQCLADRKTVRNEVDAVLIMPPNGSFVNFRVPSSSPISPAVSIDPDVPVCVDVASNKSVSPTNPAAGVPMTFNLQFTNNSLAVVGFANGATNVAITDTLGANFTPTAASCTVTSGTATAPSVSLANITGATKVFSAVVPSMDNGSVVSCAITGTISTAGSYSNTATVNATSGSGRTGRVDTNTLNNSSTVNYGLVPPATVSLTKTISGAVDGYVAASTFPVTVSCVVTPTAGGQPTTVPQTVNLVPNVAQTLPIPPTTGQQTTACTVTEGTVPATVSAGFAYGTPTITPANFAAPAGGSAAPAVTVDNPLSMVMGSLTVTPTVSGLVEGYGGQAFAITVSCTGPGVTGFPQTLNLVASASQSLPVPLAANCTVSETQPPANSGYVFTAPIYNAAASVTITGENTVNIQNVLVSGAAAVPVPFLDLKMLVALMAMLLVVAAMAHRQRKQ